MKIKTLSTLALASLLALTANAASFTFETPVGATLGGQAIDAKATFVTGAGSLTITLENLEVNPTSVIQNISGISFSLSGGQTSGTLSSSSGMERWVAGDGTYTNGASVATGWVLTGLDLTVIGTAEAPAHTIIGAPDGSNVYSNANSGIAGNGPHNPFLAGPVTFTLSIDGLTSADLVSGVIFSFGTDGTPFSPPPPSVPDSGMTAVLLGLGLVAVSFFARRRTV